MLAPATLRITRVTSPSRKRIRCTSKSGGRVGDSVQGEPASLGKGALIKSIKSSDL
jgi:hypothetical protein